MVYNFQMERLMASRHHKDVEPDYQYQVWTAKTLDGNRFLCLCQQNSGTTTQAIGGQRLAAAEGNYSHNIF